MSYRFFSLVALLLLLPQTTAAEPLHIYFHEMIGQCQSIAIVEFLGWEGSAKTAFDVMEYQLRCERLLWGKQPPTGTWTVGRAQGGVTLPKGTRCLAFINQQGEFEWVGLPAHEGKSLETDVLLLEGFYDYNAYLVSPGVITLAQLEEYLEKGSYSGTIHGALHFFSIATKQMDNSNIQFDIDYQYTKDKISSSVETIGYDWKTFTGKPAVSLPAWDTRLSLVFESNMVRPMYLAGDLLSVDADGSMQAFFWVTAPEELSYLEFLEYERNERHGPPSYLLTWQSESPKGKDLTIVFDEELGRIGYVQDFRGQRCEASSTSYSEPAELRFRYGTGELILSFDPSPISKKDLDYAPEKLIRMLKITPLQGSLRLEREGKTEQLGKGFLLLKEMRFTRNANWRG